jgi:hypothetical protein
VAACTLIPFSHCDVFIVATLMVFSATPANLHLCSAQGHAEGAPAVLLGGTAVIAEDAEAEDATSTLQDEDMAPALKEQAFVSRLIRQNSMQQHR